MDVERQLELGGRTPRQVGEPPELVDAQPVAVALVVDRAVRAAPARDAGEAQWPGRKRRGRPGVQHHRLWCRDPAEPAGRDGAVGLADPFGDGDVGVVAGEDVRQPKRAPHLAETGIGVQKHTAAGGGQQLRIVAVAHHVQQQVGVAHPLQRAPAIEAGVRAVLERDRPAVLQPGRSKDVSKVGDAMVTGAGRSG